MRVTYAEPTPWGDTDSPLVKNRDVDYEFVGHRIIRPGDPEPEDDEAVFDLRVGAHVLYVAVKVEAKVCR